MKIEARFEQNGLAYTVAMQSENTLTHAKMTRAAEQVETILRDAQDKIHAVLLVTEATRKS